MQKLLPRFQTIPSPLTIDRVAMCRDDWLRDGRNVIQQPTYAGKQQKRTQPNQSERKNQTKGGNQVVEGKSGAGKLCS